MTSSNENIFLVTGPLCGEFTAERWIHRTKASDAELWCFLWSATWKKRLSKQSWCRWFETLSRSLWRHCNINELIADLNFVDHRRQHTCGASLENLHLWEISQSFLGPHPVGKCWFNRSRNRHFVDFKRHFVSRNRREHYAVTKHQFCPKNHYWLVSLCQLIMTIGSDYIYWYKSD